MRPAIIFKRIVIALILVSALCYIGDTASLYLESRHPTSTHPFETFTVPRVLAIDKKGGKIEYALDELQHEETITCVHSIFPHAGFSPCWYAKKKASQPIPTSLIVPNNTKIHFF
jgi:hypothetical protein